MLHSKYVSLPRSPGTPLNGPKVWSPSHKNFTPPNLQTDVILSPSKSVNEKNKQLNTKISRLLEYIRFDQHRRRSILDKDSRSAADTQDLQKNFARSPSLGIPKGNGKETINPFRVTSIFKFYCQKVETEGSNASFTIQYKAPDSQ